MTQTIFEKYGDEPTIMDQIDWTGNSKTAFSTLGASNHSEYTRAADDFYETPAEGVTRLLDRPDLAPSTNALIWECAAGRGAISNVLSDRGYTVYSTELRDRGFGKTGVDFLTAGRPNTEGHPLVIFTNPPFAKGLEFIKHSLELLRDGESCYFLLRLSFLEGQKRQAFFEKQNPEVVAVFGKRITCNRNGSEQMSNSGAVAFAWFKWTKGYIGKTTVEWI